MKKLILLFLVLGAGISCATCQDQMVTNLLKAPTSPIAQLLNFAPTVIEKPTDLAALWLSIKNSTGDFSKLPNCYAVDISWAELVKSKNQTLESLRGYTKFGEPIGQTFVISLGFKQFTDSTTKQTYPKTGIGIKTTLKRASWDEHTNNMYAALTRMQDSLVDLAVIANQLVQNDSAVKALLDQLKSLFIAGKQNTQEYQNLNASLVVMEADKFSLYLANTSVNLQARIKDSASKFVITRHGWSLDFAGGLTAAFPTNNIGNSLADKGGAWLTGGFVGIKQLVSILGIARYLYQPDSIFADTTGKYPTAKVSTFDAGLSINLTTKDTKFNLALEGVYRGVLNHNTPVAPSWHVVFSASYNMGDNKLISLNFGRDFNGALESGGNLIAGINLVLGFGGAKAIPTSNATTK